MYDPQVMIWEDQLQFYYKEKLTCCYNACGFRSRDYHHKQSIKQAHSTKYKKFMSGLTFMYCSVKKELILLVGHEV